MSLQKKPMRKRTGRAAATRGGTNVIANQLATTVARELTVVLRRRAPLPSVETLGAQLPGERKHLSASELAARHGPSDETLEHLRALL